MKMTTINEVETILLELKENKIACSWIANDIIKMKLAMGYDDWMDDVDDHKCPLTLKEYIESCIDTPNYMENFR